MRQVYDYEKRFAWAKRNFDKSNISKTNKEYLYQFLDEYGTDKNLTTARKQKYVSNFKTALELLNKDVDKVTIVDIRKLIQKIKAFTKAGKEVSERTKEDYWVLVKVFYKWFKKRFKKKLGEPLKEAIEYIEEYTFKVDKNKISEADILTPKEIEQLVKVCKTDRDRALIMTLWDSGARIGELLTLSNKDVTPFEHGFRIKIQHSKTTKRTLPLMESGPNLAAYINKENTNHGKKPNDAFWIDQYGDPLSYDGVRVHLKRLMQRAKIKKRVYAHLFRHSRATDLANRGWSEAKMCMWFGWKIGSEMPATYIKRSGIELEDAMLESLGLKSKEEKEPALKPKKCLYCNHMNPATNQYCENKVCGKPLDVRLLDDENEALKKMVYELIQKTLKEKNSKPSV